MRPSGMYAEIRFAQDKPEVISAKHVDGMLRLNTVNYGTIDCELTGDYQIENANTVLTALQPAQALKYRIKEDAIKKDLPRDRDHGPDGPLDEDSATSR